MKNFSIIIPHKNLPHLLQRCLDSIPARDDLEIIVVDDDSSEELVDFKSFPGTDRPDVKVIFDKQSKGAGAARNIGINKATGKWLLFADCDDTYTDRLNEFLSKYEDSEFDVIYFKANLVSEQSSRNTSLNMNIFIDNYLKSGTNIEDIKFGAWEPWNKMIRRSLVNEYNLVFDEITSSNDKMFSLKLGKIVRNIKVSPSVLYNYILRPGSIIHSKKASKFKNSFNTILRQNGLYHEVGYKRKEFVPFFLMRNRSFVNKEDIKEYIKYLRKYRTSPLEGLISNFIPQIIRKLRLR